MRSTKNYLVNQLADNILSKEDLSQIKGGKESKQEKAERKRCEKAWQEAVESAELEGRTLKLVSGNGNGNGNGIW